MENREQILKKIATQGEVEQVIQKYKGKPCSLKLSLAISELVDNGKILTVPIVYAAQKKILGVWAFTFPTITNRLNQLCKRGCRIVDSSTFSVYTFSKQ